MGFKQTKSDPCIYVSTTGRDPFYIGVYVDDMVMAGKDEASLQKVKDELGTKFEPSLKSRILESSSTSLG